MSKLCFSYQPDMPSGIGARTVAPPGLRRMPEAGPCFSYPAGVLRRMPLPCFSYSADGIQLAALGPNRKAFTTCFRY
jgi:hypothetical protein